MKKKTLPALSFYGAIVVSIFVAFLFITPKMINSHFVRNRICGYVFTETGGRLEYDKLGLSFFPRFGLTLYGASFRLPSQDLFHFKSATVTPHFWPLLRGDMELAGLILDSPGARISLPEKLQGNDLEPKWNYKDFPANLAPLLAPLTKENLTVVVHNGSITLDHKDTHLFRFERIECRITAGGGVSEMRVESGSNLWEQFSFQGRLLPASYHFEGHVKVTRFRPGAVEGYFFPEAQRLAEDGEMTLQLDLKADGLRNLQVGAEATVPHLVLNRQGKTVRIDGAHLKGGASFGNGTVELSLKELRLESPRLTVTGNISGDPEKKRTHVFLAGKEIDLDSTRKLALALAGEIDAVVDLSELLKGGDIPLVKIRSEGASIDDAFALKNMVIEGRMERGHLSLSGLGMEFKDVKGDVKISDGILEGSGIDAEMGGGFVKNARIKLDLLHDDGPFQVDGEVAADHAHLFPVLEGMLGKTPFSREFARIKKIEGSAEGKIALHGTLRSFKTDVDVSRFNLKAVYEPVPYPILIRSGQFHYDDSGMAVKQLTGTLGRSSFSGLGGELKWEPGLHLSVSSGTLEIVLDEIYPWIASAAGLKEDLGDIKEATGRLDLAGVKFEGDLSRPESWKYQGEGALKSVRVVTPKLPEPLLVSHGEFKADSSTILLKDTDMVVSDCRLMSDVAIQDYRHGIQSFRADFRGTVGPKMVEWISKKAQLPDKFRIKAPLSFSSSQIDWKNDGQLSVAAEVISGQGVKVSLDLSKEKKAFDLRRLVISDDVSNGSFQLKAKEEMFDAGFSGTLHRQTFDKLLMRRPILTGEMEGNFKAHVPLKMPRESNLSGRLHVKGLDLEALNVPLKIEEISLRTEEKAIDLETMAFVWEERRGTANGRITFSEKDVIADLDLSLDELDWKNIETLLSDRDAEKAPLPGKKEDGEVSHSGSFSRCGGEIQL